MKKKDVKDHKIEQPEETAKSCAQGETQKEAPKEKKQPPILQGTPFKFWEEDGVLKLECDLKRFPNGIEEILGAKDSELCTHILHKTSFAINPNDSMAPYTQNLVFQSFYDQKPKDAVEARLISQAAALYSQGMDYLAMVEKTERIDRMQLYGNLAIKILRLHNETIEALNRHRRGGEQRVIVQHVAEKMAVVNHFGTQGGGDKQKNKGDTSCSKSAVQEPKETGLNHADNMP